MFIADFGGSLGFLLGVSILSVLEILEGLFLSGYRMWKGSRKVTRSSSMKQSGNSRNKENSKKLDDLILNADIRRRKRFYSDASEDVVNNVEMMDKF